MMADTTDTVVEEQECFECWNRFLVRRVRDPLQTPFLKPTLSAEWACPYCSRLNEFDMSVVGVERLQISEPRRLLANLTRRLFVAKVDAEVRERERQRSLRSSARSRTEAKGR